MIKCLVSRITEESRINNPQYERGLDCLLEEAVKSSYESVNSISRYAFEARGKLIRAQIACTTAKSLGYRKQPPADLLVALELLQAYTLIHDDVVDQSIKRRGMDSIWKRFGYEKAILYGDYLASLSLERITSTKEISDVCKLALIREFSNTSRILQEGQIEEEERKHDLSVSVPEYVAISKAKTSALIYFSSYLGWASGAREAEAPSNLKTFADQFGIGLQIYNDIVDVTFGQGKEPFDDLKSGRISFPLILLLRRSDSAGTLIEEYFKSAGEDTLEAIKSELQRQNVYNESYSVMCECFQKSKKSFQLSTGCYSSTQLDRLIHQLEAQLLNYFQDSSDSRSPRLTLSLGPSHF